MRGTPHTSSDDGRGTEHDVNRLELRTEEWGAAGLHIAFMALCLSRLDASAISRSADWKLCFCSSLCVSCLSRSLRRCQAVPELILCALPALLHVFASLHWYSAGARGGNTREELPPAPGGAGFS
ncbi:hypothetical protein NDU88_004478 [Pleurodeles waltl]|uniref:Uncharacterized protein n=1 Tax=Pleurodeles waltl TaxID=8319 RepID=A0AAV7RLG2_PLEWA|nr:hypothetical protein NDU88_004478 [Pleurodeles waltl]